MEDESVLCVILIPGIMQRPLRLVYSQHTVVSQSSHSLPHFKVYHTSPKGSCLFGPFGSGVIRMLSQLHATLFVLIFMRIHAYQYQVVKVKEWLESLKVQVMRAQWRLRSLSFMFVFLVGLLVEKLLPLLKC